MALQNLMQFDSGNYLSAMEAGRKSGLERLAQTNRRNLGNVLANTDYASGAKAAFGMGELEMGSGLAKLAMQQQEAQQEAARQQAIGQALSSALPPDLGALAGLAPNLAVQMYNAQQQTAAKQQQAQTTSDYRERQLDQTDRRIKIQEEKLKGDKRVSPTALNMKAKSEDSLAQYDGALEQLLAARNILAPDGQLGNSKVLDGLGAGLVGSAAAKLPDILVPDSIATPEQGEATTEFNNIMSLQAIEAMSQALTGATTNFELNEFKKIMADPDVPNPIKLRTLDRMIDRVNARKTVVTNRIGEMIQADQGQQPDYPGADGVTDEDIGGLSTEGAQYPQEAIEMLASDPSPEARQEFDMIFGEGASLRVLGQ